MCSRPDSAASTRQASRAARVNCWGKRANPLREFCTWMSPGPMRRCLPDPGSSAITAADPDPLQFLHVGNRPGSCRFRELAGLVAAAVATRARSSGTSEASRWHPEKTTRRQQAGGLWLEGPHSPGRRPAARPPRPYASGLPPTGHPFAAELGFLAIDRGALICSDQVATEWTATAMDCFCSSSVAHRFKEPTSSPGRRGCQQAFPASA